MKNVVLNNREEVIKELSKVLFKVESDMPRRIFIDIYLKVENGNGKLIVHDAPDQNSYPAGDDLYLVRSFNPNYDDHVEAYTATSDSPAADLADALDMPYDDLLSEAMADAGIEDPDDVDDVEDLVVQYVRNDSAMYAKIEDAYKEWLPSAVDFNLLAEEYLDEAFREDD